jgi:hypothetical protein
MTMSELVPVDDLVSLTHWGRDHLTAANTMCNWRDRHVNFPLPLYAHGHCAVYSRIELDAWYAWFTDKDERRRAKLAADHRRA